MHIKKFNIQNFKSFKDVTIEFNPDINILTGKNNAGKTTVLEAIALWHECFSNLIHQAKKTEKAFKKGQWILGPSYNRYFPFEQINSVRSPYIQDIFHNRIKNNKINLTATLINVEFEQEEEIEISFQIGESGMNYVIGASVGGKNYYDKFNQFFNKLPEPFGLYYASPVSAIEQKENFVTEPQIKEAIRTRKSASVIRNRIYKLYQTNRFRDFLSDLSFILYNKTNPELSLINQSDIQRDTRVFINFKIGQNDIEKDIALLGSGSLQTIEILLNVYEESQEAKDLNIILLDEPDSHIHRDIQQRLLEVLTRFSKGNQVFLSTHNESLIRSASYHSLFHLDGKPESSIKNISQAEATKIAPHFKGIYPSQINPIIRSVGNASGLDFINAIEADKLIFVEGEDDARAFHYLLRQNISNQHKKFMFWVLGGISRVFEDILAYKTVFSNIRNDKTLWEKSVLIFDKDFLSDEHKLVLTQKFKSVLGLNAFSANAYTFESTLMSDLGRLAEILWLWCEQKNGSLPDKNNLEGLLNNEMQAIKKSIENRFDNKYYENIHWQYKTLIHKAKSTFNEKGKSINLNEEQIQNYVKEYINYSLLNNNIYKLMNKKEVEIVINQAVSQYGLSFSIENDFIDLIRKADKAHWINEWDFLNQI
jgi:AAA15 family ATPase/GTPase